MELNDILSLILNCLSIISCVIGVSIYIYSKRIHSFPLELSTYLIGFIGMYNISNMLSYLPSKENEKTSLSCILEATFTYYFELSSSLWTTIIGYTSYQSLVNQKFILNNQKRLRLIFLVITLVIPLVFVLIVYFSGMLNRPIDYKGCEIKFTEKINNEYKFITKGLIYCLIYYSMTWIVVIYNIYCITMLILNIKKLRIDGISFNKYTIKLIWYPMIQIVSYIPSTVNIAIELITKNEEDIPHALVIIEILFDSLNGFLYCIVFGYNKEIIRYLATTCCHCFKQTSINESIEEIDIDIASKLELNETKEIASEFDDNILNNSLNDSLRK